MKAPLDATIEHIGDDFTVRVWHDGGYAYFEVFDVVAWPGNAGEPSLYREQGSTHGETPDINKAEMLVHGSIRFDDGAHVYFTDYIHGDRRMMTQLGAVFGRIYDIANALFPEHEGRYLGKDAP